MILEIDFYYQEERKMNEERMQLTKEAMSGANSLDFVLTQLGMAKETDEKIMEWATEMSLDGNGKLGCNIVLLANKLTNKMKKHFPNQYSVKLYTDLKDEKMYQELVNFTLQKIDVSKKKKKADQINNLNVIHSRCSLDELKEGDIGIGVFVKALSLSQIFNPICSVLKSWNQEITGLQNHYMMIQKTKDGIKVYDPHCDNHRAYQLSNNHVVTDTHYIFSGISVIVSKGE